MTLWVFVQFVGQLKELNVFRILTLADIHISDQGPISRKDNYKETILNKLEQVKDLCETLRIDLVLISGDIFHIKTPTKNSHFLVSQLITLFKSYPCPIYTIFGNHDLRHNNIQTLINQPLNTLLKSGACNLITDNIFSENNSIRIFSVDFLQNPEYASFNKESMGEKVQIVVAHVTASSTFTDLFGERVYSYQELSKCSPDVFVFGHYHPDQDIEVINNKHFINVGSISRGSLKKDELNRIPSCGYIEVDDSFNISTKKIPLTVLTPDEIFDVDLKQKEEKETEEIQRFITELKGKLLVDHSENIIEKVKSLDFEKDIIEKALYYLEKGL